MIELDPAIPPQEKTKFIESSLFTAGREDIINLSKFLQILEGLEKEYMNKETKDYVLASRISLPQNQTYPSFFVGRNLIKINPKKEIVQNLDYLTSFQKFEIKKFDQYSQIYIRVKARSSSEAFEKGLLYLDYFRGIWNLFRNRKKVSRLSTNQFKPINTILLSPIITLHSSKNKSQLSFYYSSLLQDHPLAEKFECDLEAFHSYFNEVNSKAHSQPYSAFLIESIAKYSRSIDTINWEVSFLKLWSLFEKLTNTRGNYDTAISRASFLYTDKSFVSCMLECLRVYRNDHIHDTKTSEHIEPIMYIIKNVVEKFLTDLIYNKKFKSLTEIYSFLDSPREIQKVEEKMRMLSIVHDFLKK